MSGPGEKNSLAQFHLASVGCFSQDLKALSKKGQYQYRVLLHLIFTEQSTKVDIHSGLTQLRQVLTFTALLISSLVE